ncbi:MAG: hypothetical protein M0P94_04525 [Candidatus Absconditabacterales bacterium]|nr:hypothetical protein [Candidatus Absconditabacterales bacterium]
MTKTYRKADYVLLDANTLRRWENLLQIGGLNTKAKVKNEIIKILQGKENDGKGQMKKEHTQKKGKN